MKRTSLVLFVVLSFASASLILLPLREMQPLVKFLLEVCVVCGFLGYFLSSVLRQSRLEIIVAAVSVLMVVAGVYHIVLEVESLWMSFAVLVVMALGKHVWMRRREIFTWDWKEWIILSLAISGGFGMLTIVLKVMTLSGALVLVHRPSYMVGNLIDSIRATVSRGPLKLGLFIVSGFMIVAISSLLRRLLNAFLIHRKIEPSQVWKVLLISWLVGISMFAVTAITLVLNDPLRSVLGLGEAYDALQMIMPLLGFLMIAVIPVVMAGRYGTSVRARRLTYVAATSIIILGCANVFVRWPIASSLMGEWYMAVAGASEARQPISLLAQKPVSGKPLILNVLHLDGMPATDVVGLIEILASSNPRAIVMPSWTFGNDSMVRANVRNVPLILNGKYIDSVYVSGDAIRTHLLINPNQELSTQDIPYGKSNPVTAFYPLYGRMLDIAVATVYEMRTREWLLRGVESNSPLERPTLQSILSPRRCNEWIHVSPYHKSWSQLEVCWHTGPEEELKFRGFHYGYEGIFLNLEDKCVYSWDREKYQLTSKMAEIPDIRGRVVILTPMSENPWDWRDWNSSRALVTATIIQNILDGRSIEKPTTLQSIIALIIFLLCIGAFYHVQKPWKALGSSGLLMIGIGVVSMIAFAGMRLFVDPVPFLAVFVGSTVFFLPFEIASDRRVLLEERARMSQELRTAHDMQMGLMPTGDPVVRGFDISGICKPADEVGGDYFDYVWLDDKKSKLGIAVADVSGKAMKAAITAVMTSGMVYREVGTNETPKGILRRINKPIYLKTDRRIFTAMSFAVFDIKRKKMAFSNAGQMLPLLMRGGKIQTLKVDGAHFPLGMAEDVEYKESALQLRKGDMVVFYTDGVPEAMNAKNQMFGFERLETIVKESEGDLSAKQVAAKIVEKVAEFAGSAKQHDDMTVVVVKVS